MSDANLAITGKDVSLELIVDAVPMKIVDKVTRFSAEAMYDTIEVKHLGSSDRDIDKEPTGWKGTLEISRKTSALDDMIDAYNLARINRVPTLLVISETVFYRDGTSSSHIYPDVKIDFATEAARGQASTVRLNWDCGTQRI